MVHLIETAKTIPLTDNQSAQIKLKTTAKSHHRTLNHNRRSKSTTNNNTNNNKNVNKKHRRNKNNALSATTTTATTTESQAATRHAEQSIATMVDRFVQSISQINDSATFESSFEVKSVSALGLGLGLNSPQRVRHRCVTELDRQNLMRFVQDLEDKQQQQQHGGPRSDSNNNSSSANSSAKNSPLLVRKAKAIYQQAFHGSRSASPKDGRRRAVEADVQSQDSGQGGTLSDDVAGRDDGTFQRALPERGSLRSAAKMLQLFATKRRSKHNFAPVPTSNSSNPSGSSSRCSSGSGSPVLLRTHSALGRALQSVASVEGEELPLAELQDDEYEAEEDDGISMASSSDSSLQLHAPLVPTFKVTPPQLSKQARSSAANDFVRFLRGSFHAKRATIATLRRTSSDPEAIQRATLRTANATAAAICPLALSNAVAVADADGNNNNNSSSNDNNNNNKAGTFKMPMATAKGKAAKSLVLADATNVIRTTNESPLRRVLVTSSFRTPRSDKNTYPSPLLLRSASMSLSDNDVYTRQMDATTTTATTNTANIETKNKYLIMPSKLAMPPPKDAMHKHANHTNGNNNNNANAPSTCVWPASKLPQPKATKSEKSSSSKGGGVASWSKTFENLLEDPDGLQTFAEFLKKEFSAENIYFWTACERFRYIEGCAERIEEASNIFNRYLSDRAMEPVNVDSRARNLTQENLSGGDSELFAVAQRQIFNLMKFDSYQRFIRSDLYKKCLEAQEKHRPLPYASESIDDLLKINFQQPASTKLKKSASNAEDRHRKSLLPWHRKSRSKSRDGNGTGVAGGDTERLTKLPQPTTNNLKVPNVSHDSNTDVHSSRSSLSSFDAFPGVLTTCNGSSIEVTTYPCRFRLNDNSTTMIRPMEDETIDHLVKRLLEKRRLKYSAYHLIDAATMKSIETNQTAQSLAGKEVLLEQRVAFKLYLPDPKVISVKSKPMKPLHEVVRSILERYNYSINAVQVLRRETQTPLDLSLPVTVADGQYLEIVANNSSAMYQNDNVTKCPLLPKAPTASAPIAAPVEGANKAVNELVQKKDDGDSASCEARRPTQTYDLCSIKSEECGSESSSVFDRTRKRDANMPYVKKTKLKSCSSIPDEPKFSIAAPAHMTVEDMKKPIIAKLKAGVNIQNAERVAEHQEELFEGLKRAQQARLEDQRGTEINAELPDFLSNKENLSAAASKLRKVRANLSPVSKTTTAPASANQLTSSLTATPIDECSRSGFPQPAPRLSITSKTKLLNNGDNTETHEVNATTPDLQIACSSTTMAASILVPNSDNANASEANSSNSSMDSDYMGTSSTDCKGPPPLPPKPKILPIKPSNWSTFGVCARRQTSTTSSTSMNITAVEPSSSFV